MKFKRMPIEIEAPEQMGYSNVRFNLTESSYSDFRMKDLGIDLNELLLSYIDHRGHRGLRNLLSAETGGTIHPDHVLITSGAAQALFIISSSLLNPSDEIVVVRPNYATNLETPRALGASLRVIDLKFEHGFKTSAEEIQRTISQKTKLVSITVPHNPTGACLSEAEIEEIVEITRKAGCRLLVDETYREMNFNGVLPHSATRGSHVISVASFSKTFGLPGIRVGWLMTSDPELYETFFAAKEQIQICGSALDEEIAFQFLQRKVEFLPSILSSISNRFSILKNWMNSQHHLEWVEPSGGCVAFPRFKNSLRSELNLDLFYKNLNEKFETFVGPGHWFEQDPYSFRLGYGWPTDQDLKAGLDRITRATELALR